MTIFPQLSNVVPYCQGNPDGVIRKPLATSNYNLKISKKVTISMTSNIYLHRDMSQKALYQFCLRGTDLPEPKNGNFSLAVKYDGES